MILARTQAVQTRAFLFGKLRLDVENVNEIIISEPFEGSAWLDIIERGLQAQIRLVLLFVVVLEAAGLFKEI